MTTMLKWSTPLLLILSALPFGHSQAQVVQTCTVYFDVDSDSLSAKALATLDSVRASLGNIPPAYRIRLEGYSDAIGSVPYNQALAERRVQAVAKQFAAFRHFATKAWGEAKPVASNDHAAGKARNRRVEITIEARTPVLEHIGSARLQPSRYSIDNQKGGTITHPSGTRITVPVGIFIDQKGHPIKGKVDLDYLEYRDPIDFILSGIPMSDINGQAGDHFNSAGMFTLQAQKDGQPVQLQKGQQLEVDFEPTQSLDDMSFFQLEADGQQWSLSGSSSGTDGHGVHGAYAEESTKRYYHCTRDPDLRRYQLVTKGAVYLDSLGHVPTFIRTIDSLVTYRDSVLHPRIEPKRAEANRNFYRLENANHTYRKYRQDYMPVIQHSNGRRLVFFLNEGYKGDLNPENSSKPAPSVFKNVRWVYTTQHMDSLLRQPHFWKNIQIQKSSSGKRHYDISMDVETSKGTYPITLRRVTMLPKKGLPAKVRRTLPSTVMSRYKQATTRRDEAAQTLEKVRARQEVLRQEQKQDFADIRRIDSLIDISRAMRCFKMDHLDYMTAEERDMDWKDWFAQFETNKADYRALYQRLAQDSTYLATKQEVEARMEQRRRSDSIVQARFRELEEQKQTLSAMSQRFGISSLGTYNCDQIKRLPNATELLADYQDQDGKTIKPVCIYLINAAMNGSILYNGYRGLHPYKFVYGKGFKNVLLAFDENNKGYFVTPEQFETIKKSRKKTFILTPIQPDMPKETLLSAL